MFLFDAQRGIIMKVKVKKRRLKLRLSEPNVPVRNHRMKLPRYKYYTILSHIVSLRNRRCNLKPSAIYWPGYILLDLLNSAQNIKIFYHVNNINITSTFRAKTIHWKLVLFM